MSNPDYRRLNCHSNSAINYYVNPTIRFTFSRSAVVDAITPAADMWDGETSYGVFSYKGTTAAVAGDRTAMTWFSWGICFQANAIAVTFIWARAESAED